MLNTICAFKLIKFQNKFKDHDLSQEEKARLDNLRRRMLSIGISIIEQKDLFFKNGISTKKTRSRNVSIQGKRRKVTYENDGCTK